MNIHRSAHVHDTRREQRKEATTRSGATAPTDRHCADKARHTTREQDKISILRGSQNIPPDWESPSDMLLISSTENCVSSCYQHGTPWQQQGDREPKEKPNTPKRVETRFKTLQLQHISFHFISYHFIPCHFISFHVISFLFISFHVLSIPRLIGRDPGLHRVHQISRFHFTHGICLILPRLQILERAQTRRLLH